MGEITPAPLPTSVTFTVAPVARDNSDRAELTCIWCNLRGCDGTIALLGGGRVIVCGMHARCLAMHEEVMRARGSARR